MGVDKMMEISPEFIDRIEDLRAKKNIQEQVKQLSAIANTVSDLLKLSADTKKNTDQLAALSELKQLGQKLDESKKVLVALNAKETKFPEFNTDPIVDVVKRVEAAINKIELSPQFNPNFTPNITVDAPQVKVDAPQVNVDTSSLSKLLKTDLPRAFEQAIGKIPETPETDIEPISKRLDEVITYLKDIDTGVRMKPEPGTIRVTNPDGSIVGNAPASLLTTRYDYVATPIYVGEASVGTAAASTGWTITKYDLTDSSNASGKVATDVSWNNRASGSYQ